MSVQERDPCPHRIFDDIGGAFAMGAIGGGVWNSVKGARNSPRGERLLGSVTAVKARAPVMGGARQPRSVPSWRSARSGCRLCMRSGSSLLDGSGVSVRRQLCRLGRALLELRLLSGRHPQKGGPVELHHFRRRDGRSPCRPRGLARRRPLCGGRWRAARDD